jgi:hypothetical protein
VLLVLFGAMIFCARATNRQRHVDLAEIQRQAKLNRDTVPQRQGIATMLFRELSEAFADDTPEAEEDSNMPTENDLIYGTRAIANFLEIPLQRCRELIIDNAIPTFVMPGSTTSCARKSALNARWQALEEAAKAA